MCPWTQARYGYSYTSDMYADLPSLPDFCVMTFLVMRFGEQFFFLTESEWKGHS